MRIEDRAAELMQERKALELWLREITARKQRRIRQIGVELRKVRTGEAGNGRESVLDGTP